MRVAERSIQFLQQLRNHFARQPEAEQALPARTMLATFFAGAEEEELASQEAQKRVIYERVDPEIQKGLQGPRKRRSGPSLKILALFIALPRSR